jgi:ParB-like chromosome segregation protein Spo0J
MMNTAPTTAPSDVLGSISGKPGHVRVLGEMREIALSQIKPTPENDEVYRPFDATTPENRALIASVKEKGIIEPLVLSSDFFILSGHRRYGAARAARLKSAPCRFKNVRRGDPEFMVLLREFNRQRVKNLSEQLREAVIDSDPDEAYEALLEHREERSRLEVATVAIEGQMKRDRISPAKVPMMRAIAKVLDARRAFWPLSDRSIHYALLNAPPLIHASKPDSIYENNLKSYKALTDLLTRARLVNRIPMAAIADPTRPVSLWDVHESPSSFFDQELENFLKGYRRNLQQSQPNHFEIVGEKMTVQSTLEPVAGRFNIPLTIGRGFSSLEPRFKLAQRFKASGKQRLILFVLSDFDPSGKEISQSFARSLRDDFSIANIELLQVALSAEQISRFSLPPMMEAKTSDSRAAKFIEEFGSAVYELEALPPETLQAELTRSIESVLDTRAFNLELDAERNDAVYLDQARQRAHIALKKAA